MKDKHPAWIRVRVAPSKLEKINSIIKQYQLNTVCNEALCPNRGICFMKKTATFLILGKTCTRACAFCSIQKGVPPKFDFNQEISNIIKAIKKLNLKHVVITSVTRDDLNDGGASHFVNIITLVKKKYPQVSIEVLIPDFQGKIKSLLKVINAQPHVINHNLETVPRLYNIIRPRANFQTSLKLLKLVKKNNHHIATKSGLMVGLGETINELGQVFRKLKAVNCDIVTVGQYLQPTPNQTVVKKYYSDKEFAIIKKMLRELNFRSFFVGPLVRSSFNAGYFFQKLNH